MTGEITIAATVIAGASTPEADERAIGGKAAGLARLLESGARVPAFCVVPAEAFRAHLRSPDVVAALGEAVLALGEQDGEEGEARAALEAASARLRAAIMDAPVTSELREEIGAALGDLGPGPYAVRSSMVGEDSAEYSFAGQLESELFQPGLDEVVESVRRCWASAFSPRALLYAQSAGISPAAVHVGVVIQAMVDAEVAGVAFSVNPITGARDECVLTASYGLGEGVVTDVAPADEYVWSPEDGERSAKVAVKDVKVVAAGSGRGTETVPVPEGERELRALDPSRVAAVGALVRSVADGAGRAVDVEWCYAGGELHVLQARPVTALAPDPAGTGQIRVFDNSNIQESYNGVTTPLTFSFASRLYGLVYPILLRKIGVPEHSMKDFEPASRNMLGLVGGRIFYNLGSWREMLELFPGGRKRIEDVETVMFHTKIGTTDDEHASRRDWLRHQAEMAGVAARLFYYVGRADREIDRYVEHFEGVNERFDRPRLAEKTLDELHVALGEFFRDVAERAAGAYINDLRVAMTSGRLRKQLEALYEPHEVDGRLADLLGGIEGVESVEPTRQLMRLARDLRRDGELLAAVRAGGPELVSERLRERSPELARRLDEWVERYGDRTIGELKLETVSMRDDPRFLGEVILNYLDRPDLDPDATERAEQERFERAVREISARVPAWRRPLFRRSVDAARNAVKYRERLRLRRTWSFALARDIYNAIGLRLHEAGLLAEPRDVLHLTVDEIDQFLEGRAVSVDLAAIAAARQEEWARHLLESPPDRFQTAGPPYLSPRAPIETDDEVAPSVDGRLRGLGCCPGVVEAPVRIILDPSESLSVNGQILCTVRTDPGWAPLFPTASGLVVERGSTLSHSAVVARELGIPTVVGVPGVTTTLNDGERVRVDGEAGTVDRLDREEGE